MSNHRIPTFANTGRLLAAACTIVALSAAAEAQTITYVAATGNDANPCTVITAPCRTLQQAINAVLASGEVRMLTPLQGNAVVLKSLTISGDGLALVGIIVVNSASAIVTVRGLALNGINGFVNGIRIDAAAAVHIDDCTVERFTGNGIQLAAATGELYISNTIVRNNTGDGLHAAEGGAAGRRVTIENSSFLNNGSEGAELNDARTTATHSTFAGNASSGVEQDDGAGNFSWTTSANNLGSGYSVLSPGEMSLDFVVARQNSNSGLFVGAGATARISDSAVTFNGTGINNNGTTLTRENNTVRDNSDDLGGNALTPFAPT